MSVCQQESDRTVVDQVYLHVGGENTGRHRVVLLVQVSGGMLVQLPGQCGRCGTCVVVPAAGSTMKLLWRRKR